MTALFCFLSFGLSAGMTCGLVDFPRGSVVKNPPVDARNAENTVLVPESERCPGEGNGNPLQYSYLGNAMDREAWQATAHGIVKSWTQLSAHTVTGK